jgi:hypothetical protein
MFLKHLGQEKLKFQFQIKVVDLLYFEQGFKLKNVDFEDSFFVNFE